MAVIKIQRDAQSGAFLNFDFSAEQILLRDSVAGYLARHYGFDARRAALANGGSRPEVWRGFGDELGLFGAALPEAHGGYGGPIEAMLIQEEFGKAIVLEPYLESILLAGALLRESGDAGRPHLAALIDGRARFAPALIEADARFNLASVAATATREGDLWRIEGAKISVVGAAEATHLLVSARIAGAQRDRAGIGLFIVDATADGVDRHDYALIDGRRAADMTLARAPGIMLSEDALPILERATDEAIAALCAEAVGVMRAMLDATVDYAKQREQFGRPIGSFQVLQHRMVDMLTLIERSISMTYMATLSLDLPDRERRKAVSAAKAFIAAAARTVGQGAIQIHGGIGTTEELAISHYFKRATVIESQFGSAAYHLRRVAEATAFG